MNDITVLFRFYLASTLILLLTLPIGWLFFQKTSKHLVLFSRFLGLLLANFTVWILSAMGILSFSGRGIIVTLLLLAVTGLFLCRIRGVKISHIQSWFSQNWKTLVFDEVVLLIGLIFFAILISHQPKIFGTEKQMDFMFLNGFMRGTEIPPHDPWFSGASINYYYGGYMITALLGRLSALPPAFTYNLMLAFLFAGTFAISWAFGESLTHSRKLGLLAPLTVGVMGNLDGLLQVIQVGAPYKINYFSSSRVIVDGTGSQTGSTINEFPFFSFYHADLHPHVVSIIFLLLFVAILYEFLLHLRPHYSKSEYIALAGRILVLSICIGSLGFINGLDLPTFGLLFAGVILFGCLKVYIFDDVNHRSLFRRIVLGLGFAFLIVILSGGLGYLLHLPFYGNFIAPQQDAGMLGFNDYNSDFIEFTTVFHLQLFLLAIYLIALFASIGEESNPKLFRLALLGLGVLFTLVFAITGYFYISILLILLLMSVYSIFWNFQKPNELLIAILLTLSLGILLGCELIHINDSYGKQLQRMNTLFKLHFQAWILIGLSAPMIFLGLRQSKGLPEGFKGLLRGILIFLLLCNLVYPFGVSWARLRQPKEGLDGMAYLDREHPRDAGAIRWLNQNVEGIPVILEYPGKKAYDYNSRVSTNTGLPTLVGWINHEQLWRKTWAKENNTARETLEKANRPLDGWSLTGYRQSIADRIYQESDIEKILPLIKEFNIEYIYVGELERSNYPGSGLNKFEGIFQKVYPVSSKFQDDAAIYRVPEQYR